MNIKELEEIMISNGIVIRAIPKKSIEIYEKFHADSLKKQGVKVEVKYLENYRREMAVVERVPENAGKFVIEINQGTSSIVKFKDKVFYNSIEEAIKGIMEKE